MESRSDYTDNEMSLEKLLEMEELEGSLRQKRNAEALKLINSPVLNEGIKKAFENRDEHKKSLELAIECSKDFCEKMEGSLQKIERDVEDIKTALTELRKRGVGYEIENECTDYPCQPQQCPSTGLASCWNSCLVMRQWMILTLVVVILALVVILFARK